MIGDLTKERVLQENDVERAANLHREYRDYYMEETWRWVIAGLQYSSPQTNTDFF